MSNDICDPLRDTQHFPQMTEFELVAILSVQVIFQLNSDYCTKVVITGGLHCIILNYEAVLGLDRHLLVDSPNYLKVC